MLILSRHIGESLIIDKKIKVTILGVRRGQIRVGIEAPKDVDVHREEIFVKIQEAFVMQSTCFEEEKKVCNGE